MREQDKITAKLLWEPDWYVKLEMKAGEIAKSLGYRRAAGYLRNRGISLGVAHVMLFGRSPRFP